MFRAKIPLILAHVAGRIIDKHTKSFSLLFVLLLFRAQVLFAPEPLLPIAAATFPAAPLTIRQSVCLQWDRAGRG